HPHLWRRGWGRRVLLGLEHARPTRRRDQWDRAVGSGSGRRRRTLRGGERGGSLHLRAHDHGRRVLLGLEWLGPTRRRDHDRSLEPRARGGGPELQGSGGGVLPNPRGPRGWRRLILGL